MSEESSKITVVKTKPLKSSTNVKGIVVTCSNESHYAIIKMLPSRNPWFIRGLPSSVTGRTDTKKDNALFSQRRSTEPNLQDGIEMLLMALNGEEVPMDKIAY